LSFARAARLERQHAEDERRAKEEAKWQALIGQQRAEAEDARLRAAREEAERVVTEGEWVKRLGITDKFRKLGGKDMPLDSKDMAIQVVLIEAEVERIFYSPVGGKFTDAPAAEFIIDLAAQHPELKTVPYAAAQIYLRLAAEARVDQKVPESDRQARADAYATKAFFMLVLAYEIGHFRDHRNTDRFKDDRERPLFGPLRDRDWFKKFVGIVERP
jgi:hypothetical protein